MMELVKAKTIDGWMSDRELEWLAQVAKTCNVIVEFGCYKGRSTRALADNTPGTVYAVDPWNGDYYDNDNKVHGIRTDVYFEFEQNLLDHIRNGRVIPVQEFSDYFNLPNEIKADLVFIDGDHRYEQVVKDIKKAKSLLNRGGIISGHDYTHPEWYGVTQAVNAAFASFNRIDSIWWVRVE